MLHVFILSWKDVGKKNNESISQVAVKPEHRAWHFAFGALLGIYFSPLSSYLLVDIISFDSYFKDNFISF